MNLMTNLPNSKNVCVRVEGPILYIYCDLSKDFGVSSTGKSIVIASSSGNKALGKSNAFLGLNLFVKSLDKRQLTQKGVEKLRQEDFEPVGNGCQWRVEEDGITLCIKIDFSSCTEKPASSGKSILLATTSGNKAVGDTGIMCGLNCYRSEGKPLDIAKLSAKSGDEIDRGEKKEIGTGVVVSRDSASDTVTVHISSLSRVFAEAEGESSGSSASFSFSLAGDNTQVSLHLKPVKPKKRKIEKDDDQEEKKCSGFSGSASSKVRNLSCHLSTDKDTLDFSFNSSLSFGVSSSGKSITVSSSSGFQIIYDAAGEEVCSVNFNAYKSASSSTITTSDVENAVKSVLEAVPKESLSSLTFKTVFEDVVSKLRMTEDMGERYKKVIKEQVTTFMQKA